MTSRIDALDMLRGVALLGMGVFHLAFDLSVFGLIETAVAASPAWMTLARLVAGAFLALSGVALVLATQGGMRWPAYAKRLARITAAAAAVSLATWFFDPGSFIFFGVLHSIALAGILALPFLRAPAWAIAAAAGFLLLAGDALASPFFNGWAWYWLGLSTKIPYSADFIPVFPWFGIVLCGMLGGRALLAVPQAWPWHWQANSALPRILALAGRWSLAIYLLHQPILIGLLMAWGALIGR